MSRNNVNLFAYWVRKILFFILNVNVLSFWFLAKSKKLQERSLEVQFHKVKMIQGLGFKILKKGIFLKGQELDLIKQNPKNQTTTTASRPNYT